MTSAELERILSINLQNYGTAALFQYRPVQSQHEALAAQRLLSYMQTLRRHGQKQSRPGRQDNPASRPGDS